MRMGPEKKHLRLAFYIQSNQLCNPSTWSGLNGKRVYENQYKLLELINIENSTIVTALLAPSFMSY